MPSHPSEPAPEHGAPGLVGDVSLALAAVLLLGGAVAAAAWWATDTSIEPPVVAAAAGGGGALAAAIAAAGLVRRRHRRVARRTLDELTHRGRVNDHDVRRRAFETELDEALRHCLDERATVEVLRTALTRMDSARPTELHLVEPDGSELRLTFATGTTAPVTAVASAPIESLAVRTGRTLVYESTDRLDACAHLRGRVTEPCSAVCVPLTALGRQIGVLYATGPHGAMPTATAVATLEHLASRAAVQIAAARGTPVPGTTETPVPGTTEPPVPGTEAPVPGTTETPVPGTTETPVPGTDVPVPGTDVPVPGTTEPPVPGTETPVPGTTEPPVPGTETPVPGTSEAASARREVGLVDPVTGLPTHATLQAHMLDLAGRGSSFAVAIIDVDGGRVYEERHGTEARDDLLRLLARVTRRSLRPTDLVGRIATDQLMAVFPETATNVAAAAIERIRESLIVAQASRPVPAFTCSFGVADSAQGESIGAIVAAAQRGVADAKRIGRNRIVTVGDRRTIGPQ